MSDAKAPVQWVTIVIYDGRPKVLRWTDPIEARAYYAKAQMQWSDACLAQVVTGCGELGGPPTEDAWDRNHLCEMIDMGKRQVKELEEEIARLKAALEERETP